MDTVQVEKAAGVQAAFEATGAILLCLPPCSLNFKPIENAFSNLEALLRAKAGRAIDDLWGNVGSLIDLPKPTQCANPFKAPDAIQNESDVFETASDRSRSVYAKNERQP